MQTLIASVPSCCGSLRLVDSFREGYLMYFFIVTAMLAKSNLVPEHVNGHWTSPPCAGTSNRHCPLGQRADGPVMGNGDLGAMLGERDGGLSFWLTKNDFWNLAIELAALTISEELFLAKVCVTCLAHNGCHVD